MRTSKTQSIQRANFVINQYAKEPSVSISEVRRRLSNQYGHSMSYMLITKYRDAVAAERAQMQNIPLQAQPVLSTAPVLPNGQPIVQMMSPVADDHAALPTEFIEGLKHLIRHTLYQNASAGTIQISASKEGEINVSCQLEEKQAAAM